MSAGTPRGPLGVRFRSLPLGLRLALLSAVVTGVVVTGVFIGLRRWIVVDARRVLVAELGARQSELRESRADHLRLLLGTASLVSTSPTIRAAVETRNAEAGGSSVSRAAITATIQREVARVYEDLGRDLLVITDDSGRVLAGKGRGAVPAPGTPLAGLPSVRRALSVDPSPADSAFGVLVLGDELTQVASVPLLVNGFPIGALILGERVDRMLPSGGQRGAGAVVTAAERIVRSTVPALPVGAAWPTTVADSGTTAVPLEAGGAELLVATLPLGVDADGRPLRLRLTRSLTESVAPLEGALTRRLLLAGLLALLLAAASGAWAARATLRPLARFVEFLRERSGSSLGRYAPDAPPVEIATLTDAYNGLVDSVARHAADLEQRTEQLAASNTELRTEIVERERAQAALRKSEEQLRQSQKLEALGTLAGGVAHDFNNVLSVIMGYAHLVAADLPETSQARTDIDQVTAGARRARDLVRQLLAFSRRQVLEMQVVELNGIVTGMQTLLRPLLGETVRLDVQLGESLPRIMADPGQLEQVLLNLVVNARDAMPNGGTITVRTRRAPLPPGLDPSEEFVTGSDAVALEVRDTGIGMDAATREQIFEPFFTTKPVGQGTGLGLSTVYGIMRQFGGAIDVASVLSEGSTFTCWFAATRAQRVTDPRLEAIPDGSGTETVLVAEDDPAVRQLVVRALGSRGYQVLEASNGREALELAGAHTAPIELLLTDVVMPEMSGIELYERIHASRPTMRVLFVSGYSAEVVARHGKIAPESAFFSKPIVPNTLAAAVRRLLDEGSLTPSRS